MSPERTDAYREVLRMLAELGPSKLQSDEEDRIRYAADSLILCDDLSADRGAREGLLDTQLLFDGLVDSGRWERVTADRLAEELRKCGPDGDTVALQAA